MTIYAISDIHGHIEELSKAMSLIDIEQENTIVVFMGDYIHGHDSYAVLDFVMDLQEKYGSDRIITLKGNHEDNVLMGIEKISEYDDVERSNVDDKKYQKWMKKNLKLYYKTDKQIFVHAGIDETIGDEWEHGTPEHIFVSKYPPTKGKFYMDIIAGHVGTASIVGDKNYNDIYFDGKSHYYIDGSVQENGRIPVLMINTDTNEYFEITEAGKKRL